MIQRFQTIFLVLACLCLALPWIFGFWDMEAPYSADNTPALEPRWTSDLGATSLYLALSIVILEILCVISIFLYKQRALQRHFVFAIMIFQIAFLGFIVYRVQNIIADMPCTCITRLNYLVCMWHYKAGSTWGLLGAWACTYLALRFIQKDERLIRSTQRIR